MAAAAPMADDADISHEMAELLRAGAADQLGLICRPGQVRKFWPLLRELERRDYLRFLDIERPWITEAGRAVIGAPSEAEADRARLLLLCGGARKPLTPAKRKDPRTDFDYRSYKSCGYVCVLAVRAADDRSDPQTVRILVSGSTKPQGLGAGNSIVMPESDGRFVLALVPRWLQRKTRLSTFGLPLPEDEPWTDDERATWGRLRDICFSINSRIRNAGARPREKFRYGESA